MKIGNSLSGAVAALAVTLFAAAVIETKVEAQSDTNSAEPAVSMIPHAFLEWDATNSLFTADAANNVMQDYSTGTPTDVVGPKLLPSYIAQSLQSPTNKILWFSVDVKVSDPTVFIQPTNLTFQFTSSDGGYLDYYDNFGTANYLLTPDAMGIVYGQDGAGVDDTFITNGVSIPSENWGTSLNRFIFIGAAGKCLGYNDADGMTAVSNYVDSFANYSVTGTWTLTYGTNTVSASITLETFPAIARPLLVITSDGAGNALISLDKSTPAGETVTIQSWETLGSTNSPTVIGVLNVGDTPLVVPASGTAAYFNGVIVQSGSQGASKSRKDAVGTASFVAPPTVMPNSAATVGRLQ